MIWLYYVLAIGIILYTFHSAFENEVQLDRIEILNSTHSGVYNFTQLRIDRLNQWSHALQTDVDILVDVDDYWEIEAYFYYNRYDTINYVQTSIQIARTALCNVFERFRPVIAFEARKNATNFPAPIFGKRICPIKAVIKLTQIDSNYYKIIFYCQCRVDIGLKIYQLLPAKCPQYFYPDFGEKRFIFTIKMQKWPRWMSTWELIALRCSFNFNKEVLLTTKLWAQ